MSRGYNARRKTRRKEARSDAEPPRRRRRESRSRRLVPILPVLAIVVVLAASAVVGFGADHGVGKEQVQGEVTDLLADIPQDGNTLGSPDAPVTLEMFADLECFTVNVFVENYLPSIIENEVRAGTVKLTYRSLKTDTDDEGTFFRQEAAALAAGRQDRMWNFLLTFVRQQGQRYTDYATSEFIEGIAAQVPDLKLARWRRDRQDSLLWKQVALGVHAAHLRGMRFTPSFSVYLNRSEVDESGPRGTAAAREFLSSFAEDLKSLRDEGFKDKPQLGVFNFN